MEPIVRVRVNLTARLFLALLIFLLILQLVTPYRGWMILLVAFGGIALGAFVWVRSLARGLRLTREIRFGWAHVGDVLEERFTLTKRGALPALWVEVNDSSNLPDYQVSIGTGVGGDSEQRWTTERVCTRRGVYNLGPTTLRTGDPFGIFNVTVEYPARMTLMVVPPLVNLPTIQVALAGRAGEGRRQQPSFEPAVSVKGIRAYAPGDSLNHIHWLSVAQRDELYVRVFDNTPASDWWIFLDLDQSVQVGADEQSTLEQSIILAASLADRGLRSAQAVGLVMHDEKLWRLTPQWGEGQRWEILRALAAARSGNVALAELLTRARPQSTRQTSLIVITPSPNPNWLDALSPWLAQGATPTVLLLDRASFDGGRDTRNLFAQLGERGIHRYLLSREMLNVSKTTLGARRDWTMGVTGRVLSRRKPIDERWRVLT